MSHLWRSPHRGGGSPLLLRVRKRMGVWLSGSSTSVGAGEELSRVGFFMQPPWKPDAPDATVAFVCDFFSFSFSFSLALLLWVSFVVTVHWASAGPGNSPLDSP